MLRKAEHGTKHEATRKIAALGKFMFEKLFLKFIGLPVDEDGDLSQSRCVDENLILNEKAKQQSLAFCLNCFCVL